MHHCYGEAVGDTAHIPPDYVATPIANFDIHPSTAGNMRIYELVLETMKVLRDIPRFTRIDSSPGQVSLEWTSGYGQEYVLERFADPCNTNNPVVVSTNSATPVLNRTTDNTPEPAGFYRLRVR